MLRLHTETCLYVSISFSEVTTLIVCKEVSSPAVFYQYILAFISLLPGTNKDKYKLYV